LKRSAWIEGPYRYRLDRTWDPSLSGLGRGRLVFVMLNPSSADGETDDPTLRRCIGFAQGLDFDSLTVCNLFALRSSSPAALLEHPDPIGPKNLAAVLEASTGADVIAAWGCFRYPVAHRERAAEIVTALLFRARSLSCLGVTVGGAPRHPLYVRSGTRPEPWPRA